MRRSFFMFLMMVLILRGLTGTAMAAGVLAPLASGGLHCAQVQNHHHEPVDALDASSHHQVQSATHVALAADTFEPGQGSTGRCGPDGQHAGTCSACEICHSAMLVPSAPSHLAAEPLEHIRPQASARFHSAPAALCIKPPIA